MDKVYVDVLVRNGPTLLGPNILSLIKLNWANVYKKNKTLTKLKNRQDSVFRKTWEIKRISGKHTGERNRNTKSSFCTRGCSYQRVKKIGRGGWHYIDSDVQMVQSDCHRTESGRLTSYLS